MKYKIIFTPTSIKDLVGIYYYIIDELGVIEIADELLNDLYRAIRNLHFFPYRCALRKIGKYSNREHRQLFVKNFTIVYRVDESHNRVLVAAVRYTPSNF